MVDFGDVGKVDDTARRCTKAFAKVIDTDSLAASRDQTLSVSSIGQGGDRRSMLRADLLKSDRLGLHRPQEQALVRAAAGKVHALMLAVRDRQRTYRSWAYLSLRFLVGVRTFFQKERLEQGGSLSEVISIFLRLIFRRTGMSGVVKRLIAI